MEYCEFQLFLEIKDSLIDVIYNSNLDLDKKAVILYSDSNTGVFHHAKQLLEKKKMGVNGSYEIDKLVDHMKENFDNKIYADKCMEMYILDHVDKENICQLIYRETRPQKINSAGGRIPTLEEPELVLEPVLEAV